MQQIFNKNEKYDILTPNGWENFDGVFLNKNANKQSKILTFTDGTNITATVDHRFFINSVEIKVGELYVGVCIDSIGGKKEISIIEDTILEDTYDIFNAENHVIIANDIHSHQCDEFAFIPNNQAEDFFTSVYPTITAGKDTKVFMTSTPNGRNFFHKFWSEAHKTGTEWNGFTPLRVHWHETPGRDQKWYDEQKAILGELKTAQEIDAEFIGSSKILFSAATLARLTHDTPIKVFDDYYTGLKIYTNPIKNHIYSICVDTSRGRHLDYSTFIVFDITTYPHTMAATYRNNEISPSLYATIIEQIGKKYNDAYLLIEINDIGGQVADILWNDLEYENMYFSKSGDQLGKTGSDKYPGIRTTTKTKRIGCAALKDMVETNQLLVNDFDFIQEASVFIQNTTGSYSADVGFHDDTIICGVLHAWMCGQPFFRDLTNSDLRLAMHNQHIQEMEDSIMLVGGFSDGTDYYEENNSRF